MTCPIALAGPSHWIEVKNASRPCCGSKADRDEPFGALVGLLELSQTGKIPPRGTASRRRQCRQGVSAEPVRPNSQALSFKVEHQNTIVGLAAVAVDPPKAAGRKLTHS